MRAFFIRLIVNAAALTVAAAILPGIHTADNAITTLLLIALIFGFLNALFKPLFVLLSCPLIILTLGLFTLVINGVMLLLTDRVAGSRFEVDTFGWAILGGFVVSIVSGILEGVLGVHDDENDHKNKRGGMVIDM